ncbi:butyrophilin-like protein 9 isoform X4 [Ambystoma mexicanum]|uniref:butyrophilin-like protein 9 isoform X4 n=1 Tax=Ambystoma mexicanum TaxID=8296 RepID=UPI0037E763A3
MDVQGLLICCISLLLYTSPLHSETFYQRISRCVVSCTLIGLSFAIVWGCLIAMTIHLFRKQTFDKGSCLGYNPGSHSLSICVVSYHSTYTQASWGTMCGSHVYQCWGTIVTDQLNQKIKAIEDELDWRRARFNKADITLDGETAPFCVVVSNKGKSVSPRPPSADAEAVNQAAMVRGSQELSCGVHYWEVDVNSKTEWSVGIFEASADGSGQVHQRQWGLSLHNNQYTCIAAGLAKALTVPERLTKVGLFWDPTKGAITLYSVDGKCKLDTFNDELTGSVWPFLNPGTYHNGENRGALTICAVPEWD